MPILPAIAEKLREKASRHAELTDELSKPEVASDPKIYPELLKERSTAWWESAAPWSVFAVGAGAALGGAGAMAFVGALVVLAGQSYGAIDALNRNDPGYPQDASAAYTQNKVFRDLYDMVGLYTLVGGGVFLALGTLLAASGAGWGSYYFVVDRSAE